MTDRLATILPPPPASVLPISLAAPDTWRDLDDCDAGPDTIPATSFPVFDTTPSPVSAEAERCPCCRRPLSLRSA